MMSIFTSSKNHSISSGHSGDNTNLDNYVAYFSMPKNTSFTAFLNSKYSFDRHKTTQIFIFTYQNPQKEMELSKFIIFNKMGVFSSISIQTTLRCCRTVPGNPEPKLLHFNTRLTAQRPFPKQKKYQQFSMVIQL